MRRPARLLALLGLLGLLAIVAAACSVGVGTPPEDYVPPDEASSGGGNGGGGGGGGEAVDLLVDGSRAAIADLRAEIGGEGIQAAQLVLYNDSAYLEAQSPDDPATLDVYNWDAGEGVSASGTKPVESDTELFRLSEVNFAAIPGLVADAPERAGVQGEITSSVTIQQSDGQVLTTVFVSTPRGQTGAVVADQDGTVVATT